MQSARPDGVAALDDGPALEAEPAAEERPATEDGPDPAHRSASDGSGRARSRSDPARRAYAVGLVLIALVALGLRVIPLFAAVPYSHYVDEGHVVRGSARTMVNGSWDPGFYDYPSGLIGATAVTGTAWATVTGDPKGLRSEARRYVRNGHYDPMPTELLVSARLLVLLSSVGVVLLVAHLGRVLVGRGVGLAGGLIAACLPALATRSATATVDAPASFFALASIACALRSRGSPHAVRWAAGAGVLAGFAAGTKYTMAIVMIVPALAVIVDGTAGWRTRALRTIATCAAGILGFALANPAFFLARGRVRNALTNLSDGYASKTGASYWDFVTLPEEVGWLLVVMAAVGTVALVARRGSRAGTLLALSFVVPFVVFVSRYDFQPFRNLYPVLALGCVAVGASVVIGGRAIGRAVGAGRTPARGLAALVVVVLALLAGSQTLDTVRAQAEAVDARTQVREWFAALDDCERVLIPRELAFHPDEFDDFGCEVEVVSALDVEREVDLSQYDYVVAGDFTYGEVAPWARPRLNRARANFGSEPISQGRWDAFRTTRQHMVVYEV